MARAESGSSVTWRDSPPPIGITQISVRTPPPFAMV